MCFADEVTPEGGPQAGSNSNDGTAEGVSNAASSTDEDTLWVDGRTYAAGSADEGTADGDSKVAGSVDEDATEGVSKPRKPADEGAPEEAAPYQFTRSAIVQVIRPQVGITIRQVSFKSVGGEGTLVETTIFESKSSPPAVITMSGVVVTG